MGIRCKTGERLSEPRLDIQRQYTKIVYIICLSSYENNDIIVWEK
jgi:hypothetical protein